MTRKKRRDNADTFSDSGKPPSISIPHDLTPEGYQEALRSLRGKSPAEARRLERFLEPILKERGIFPRRRIPWQETSQGTRMRLALLPQNPHIREDIEQVRQYLGIPKSHIRPNSRGSFWKEVSKQVKPESIRKVVEGNLVGAWLYIHREVAAGKEVQADSQISGLLTRAMIKSAVRSAGVDLTLPYVPEWARQPPDKPMPGDSQVSPIGWSVGRMIERHRLPQHVTTALTFYLLTLNSAWVKDLELIEVEIEYGSKQLGVPGAFSIKLKSLDEFITASDWNHIWKVYIEPRQRRLWRQRGRNPQGRRSVELARLKGMMGSYKKMVRDGLTFTQVFSSTLSLADQKTIRKGINDLKKLLSPLP